MREKKGTVYTGKYVNGELDGEAVYSESKGKTLVG